MQEKGQTIATADFLGSDEISTKVEKLPLLRNVDSISVTTGQKVAYIGTDTCKLVDLFLFFQ